MSLFVFAICNVCRTDFKSVLTTRTKGYIYSFYNKCNAKIIVGWLPILFNTYETKKIVL